MQAPVSPTSPKSSGKTSRLLDVRQAQAELGLSRRQILLAVERGELHAVPAPGAGQQNYGRRLYYPEWELLELKNRLAKGVGGRRRVALQLVLGLVTAASLQAQPAASHLRLQPLDTMTVIASKRRRQLAAA